MDVINNAVEMHNICKVFGTLRANWNINLKIRKGEIHAIVGENGAGKTTLMNILFGMFPPTSGKIIINGNEENISSPNKAIHLGIGMVHQHFELIPEFTVAENITLGHEPTNHIGVLNKNEAIRYTNNLSVMSGLKVNPTAKVGDLPIGLLQRVEILKAISRGAEILILDEPTAVLAPHESKELFNILRKMVQLGKTIIIITHKLKEVMEISDNITILRHGEAKGTLRTSETTESEIASRMMGKSTRFTHIKKEAVKPAAALLKVESLSVYNDSGIKVLHDLSFNVFPGQVLTIAGVEGNGQTELLEVLLGFRKACSGRVLADGYEITHLNIKQRRAHCSYILEDRMTTCLDLDASVHDNIITGLHNVSPWKTGPFINFKKTHQLAGQLIKDYSIVTENDAIETRSLSGGNQQKIVVAREINFGKKIMIIAQPSRGVDLGASNFIHEKIIEMRNKGCAILLISTDIDEVFLLSDIINVIFEGNLVASLDPAKISPEELGLFMTGVKKMEGCIRED